MPACDCGDDSRFEPGVGCVLAECPAVDPLPPMELCTQSGGAWTAGLCCNTECGMPCEAACAAPACDCGPNRVFDGLRGCEVAARCVEPGLGEPCDGLDRCADGTICCDSCGGAGCAGEPTCRLPVCDDDPDIDTCGNNLLAP